MKKGGVKTVFSLCRPVGGDMCRMCAIFTLIDYLRVFRDVYVAALVPTAITFHDRCPSPTEPLSCAFGSLYPGGGYNWKIPNMFDTVPPSAKMMLRDFRAFSEDQI